MTYNQITKGIRMGVVGITLVGMAIFEFKLCHLIRQERELLDSNSCFQNTLNDSSQYYFMEHGNSEAVLGFVSPLTGELESQILEKKERESVFRKFDVVDGKIVYLRE